MANITVTLTSTDVNVNTSTNNVTITNTPSNVVVSELPIISNSAIRTTLSAVDPILYDTGNGIFSINNTTLLSGQTTSNLTEGTNLYYTVARANSAIDARLPSTDALTEGSTNLYFTNARANAAFVDSLDNISTEISSTANITTTGKFVGDLVGNVTGNVTGDVTGTVSDISNHTTTDLAEGTNLYYTTGRANSAIIQHNADVGISNAKLVDITDTANINLLNLADVANTYQESNVDNAVLQFLGHRTIFDDSFESGRQQLAQLVKGTLVVKPSPTAPAGNVARTGFEVQGAVGEALTGASIFYAGSNPANARVGTGNVTIGGYTKINNELVVTGNTTLGNLTTTGSFTPNNINATGNISAGGTITAGGDILLPRNNKITETTSGNNFIQFYNTETGPHTQISSHSNVEIQFDNDNSEANNLNKHFRVSFGTANTATATEVMRVDKTGNLYVSGNLEVTGNINYREVEDLLVRDQEITMNYGNASAQTSSIFVDRSGSGSANTVLRWNETTDKWTFSNDGSTFYDIPASTSDLAEGTNLYYTTARANTAIANYNGNMDTDGNITAANLTADGNIISGASVFFGNNLYLNSAATAGENTSTFIYFKRSQLSGESNAYIRWSETADVLTWYDGANSYTFARTTDDLTEGSTNLYYTDNRVAAKVGDLSTDIDTEGNLTLNGNINCSSASNINISQGNIIGGYFYGNGSNLSGMYGNTEVANYLADDSSIHKIAKLRGTEFRIASNATNLAADIYSYAFPNDDGNNGEALITDGAGTLSFGAVATTYNDANVESLLSGGTLTSNIITTGNITGGYFIGDGSLLTNISGANVTTVDESRTVVKTVIAGEDLAKGDAVYISGGTGDNPEVSKADADDAAKMPVFGVTTEAVTATNTTDLVIYGLVESYDTTGLTTGDSLFVGTTAGALTTTKPTGESALLQTVGKVIKGNSSGGKITVTGAGRVNATPNLNDGNIFIGNGSNQSTTATLDTSIVPENTNLYYTQARFDTAFGNKTTSDLTEGTNLYYTSARADADIADYTGAITNLTGDVTTTANLSANNISLSNIFEFSNSQQTGTVFTHYSGNVFFADYPNNAFAGSNIHIADKGRQFGLNTQMLKIGQYETNKIPYVGSFYAGPGILTEQLHVEKGLNFGRGVVNLNLFADGSATLGNADYKFSDQLQNLSNVYINIGTGNVNGTANTVVGIKTNLNSDTRLGWHDPISRTTYAYQSEPVFDASTAPNGWYAFGDLAKTTVDETFDANLTVSGHTSLKGFNETVVALGSQSGNIAALAAFNASNASIFTVTATGGIEISQIPNAVAGSSYTIKVTQDGTGSHALTSTFKYQGGDKTLTTAAGNTDVISVVYDGTDYLATLSKDYY